MPVTLLLPGILLPSDVVRALAEPLRSLMLPTLLARARPVADAEYPAPAHLGWLADHVFGQAPPAGTAPYALAALSGTPPPPDAFLWHADPVHLELSRDHLVVLPLPAPPSEEEAAALIESADTVVRDAGATFERAGGRWFLRARRRWDLQAAPLPAVLGEPLYDAMPAGADAPTWNRLLNEIQMTWHAHPVNEAREARGDPTINSVWLHGGGAWAPLPSIRCGAIHADAPELRGAAAAAGIPSSASHSAPRDGALVVWPDAFAACLAHDRDGWITALRAVDARVAGLMRASDVDIVLAGRRRTRRYELRSGDRWKFWRSPRLEEALSE
jgi:hypothetical protein